MVRDFEKKWSRRICKKYTHTFFSCALPACLSQLVVTVVQVHTATLSRTEPTHGVARAMSCVTFHMTASSTGTPSLSSTPPVLHPLLSELEPCADPRCNLRDALAEPRPFTGYESKQLAENQDHRHFAEDELTEHEDTCQTFVIPPTDHSVDPRFSGMHPDTAPGLGLWRLATSCFAVFTVPGFTLVLTKSKCRTVASLSFWTKKLDVQFISRSDKCRETCRVVFKPEYVESRNFFRQRGFSLKTSKGFWQQWTFLQIL